MSTNNDTKNHRKFIINPERGVYSYPKWNQCSVGSFPGSSSSPKTSSEYPARVMVEVEPLTETKGAWKLSLYHTKAKVFEKFTICLFESWMTIDNFSECTWPGNYIELCNVLYQLEKHLLEYQKIALTFSAVIDLVFKKVEGGPVFINSIKKDERQVDCG